MRSPRHRRALVLVVGISLLVTGVLGITARTVFFPRDDAAIQADAIVVLGGLRSADVVDAAIQLAEAGYSDTILISDAFGKDTRPANLCARSVPVPKTAISVECFDPRPATTRGEAQALAGFAIERGWNRVIVVTASYHVSRARIQIDGCYSGTLAVIGARPTMEPRDWAYQWLYQSAAFVKARAGPPC